MSGCGGGQGGRGREGPEGVERSVDKGLGWGGRRDGGMEPGEAAAMETTV